MNDDDFTYSGGLAAMLDRYDGRRDPFDFGPETLPSLDVDLEALVTQIVPECATRIATGATNTSWSRKRIQIAEEFVGNSELAFLNAQLISNLRKRSSPQQVPALFRRLWAEQSDHLLAALDLRWLVSSVQTFADHGNTPVQREVGQALRMLFGMMKLYEFERLFSGRTPGTQFLFRRKVDASLPLEMNSYSLETGGLDINLIAPIWTRALMDNTIAPLTDHLLTELNRDPGGIFRRLKIMRDRRMAKRPRT
ncbi:hypothetical protein [Ruegeria sp. HKCCD8929]|uniref:hypothetical protein n=1 Tax=Ruegeria sp. HKCCD8929 TaxID=2683006 RepID=UPI001489A49D|nr:hypothetical protein [Ruegeria sp. HKCCD8929]